MIVQRGFNILNQGVAETCHMHLMHWAPAGKKYPLVKLRKIDAQLRERVGRRVGNAFFVFVFHHISLAFPGVSVHTIRSIDRRFIFAAAQ
jgi:hypothetical protein